MTRPTQLDETARAELREIIARYPQPRSALLPMLHLVQAYEGYVTPLQISLDGVANDGLPSRDEKDNVQTENVIGGVAGHEPDVRGRLIEVG